MWAVDTNTKLLYSYGMPSDYKKIIGNNYIPQNWLPYETHPNTVDAKLKFYEYDPIGFISLEKDYNFLGVKTNVHLYDWWNESVGAGSSMKNGKTKAFLCRVFRTMRLKTGQSAMSPSRCAHLTGGRLEGRLL